MLADKFSSTEFSYKTLPRSCGDIQHLLYIPDIGLHIQAFSVNTFISTRKNKHEIKTTAKDLYFDLNNDFCFQKYSKIYLSQHQMSKIPVHAQSRRLPSLKLS